MKLDVFIPAGGIGTRLRPLTYFYPKSCLPIKGCPVITNAIESCLPYCKSLFISTYYKKEMVRKCLKNKPYFDKLLFLYDKKLKNIGGSLMYHSRSIFKESIIKEHILVIPGDHVIKNFPLKDIYKFHKTKRADVTVILTSCKPYGDYAILDDNQKIIKIINNNKDNKVRFSLTGIYLFRKSFLKNALDKCGKSSSGCDLTREIVIPSIDQPSVFGYNLSSNSYWDDAGTWIRFIKNNLIN